MVIIAAEVMYQNLAFDTLQSYQEGALGAVEGQTTQLAEKVGYKLGSANYAEKPQFWCEVVICGLAQASACAVFGKR